MKLISSQTVGDGVEILDLRADAGIERAVLRRLNIPAVSLSEGRTSMLKRTHILIALFGDCMYKRHEFGARCVGCL